MNSKMKDCGFAPTVAIPPGETIKEMIEFRGMNQSELSTRMGRPGRLVSQLISGKTAITPETACQLEAVLGASAEFWMNLEYAYQLDNARAAERRRMEEDAKLGFPYSEMAKLGWVPATRDAFERVKNLRGFFNVASLQCVQEVQALAWRKAESKKASPEAVAAWLRRGEILAGEARVGNYDAEGFEKAIPMLRSLTVSADLTELRTVCARFGVVLVFVPPLSKTYACGVARWLSEGRPVIQLTNRGRYEDILWFTFFHECAHILRHPHRVFIDLGNQEDSCNGKAQESVEQKRDNEADAFAQETLLPAIRYKRFVASMDFSPVSVRDFALREDIAPAVVVGRLLRENKIQYGSRQHQKLMGLRRSFNWPSN